MTGSHLGYDGPGSGMYRFLCKSPAPRKVQLSIYTVSQDLWSWIGDKRLYSELTGALNTYLQ